MLDPRGRSTDLVRIVESIEAAAWEDSLRAAPPEVADALGLRVRRRDGTVIGAVPCADVLALNRVVAAGLEEPIEAAELEDIVAFYRDAGAARFMVQLPPAPAAAGLAGALEEMGFYLHNHWMRLARPSGAALPRSPTELRVERVGREHAGAFAEIVAACFGWPEALHPWIAAVVGRPGWGHYMAFDGDTPVATAALFTSGGLGWIGFGATAERSRRRGAQSALIRARLSAAERAGCEWIAVETAEDLPERPNPSFHNVRRFGFDVLYARPNYVKVL